MVWKPTSSLSDPAKVTCEACKAILVELALRYDLPMVCAGCGGTNYRCVALCLYKCDDCGYAWELKL